MHGFLSVLKPPGMTSHDLVQEVRRLTGQQRVGHGGTLDPDAAGVLVLGLGQATRLLEFVKEATKSYRCEMLLGLTTSTEDLSGEVLDRREVTRLSAIQVEAALADFRGEYQQIPPMHSALHYRGRRLYDWARAGIEVERKPRRVRIHDLRLLRLYRSEGYWRLLLDITCSAGTYVRTLCADIGRRLGYGGCLGVLVRTRVGQFRLSTSVTREELAEAGPAGIRQRLLLPPDCALSSLPKGSLLPEAVRRVQNGNPIGLGVVRWETPSPPAEGQTVRLYDPDGRLVAIASVGSHTAKPYKVLGWEE
ncbi:MAG: tRNA pseudouridine(55) synthase TruB [Moorellales bacterium]